MPRVPLPTMPKQNKYLSYGNRPPSNSTNETQPSDLCDASATSNEAAKQLVAVGSHVQTRGSIPLRWSSPTDIKTYRPRVRIGTNPISQARAMRQHLIDQASRYTVLNSKQSAPGLLFVNLVDKKSDQGRLGRAMDAVLKAVLDVYTAQPDASMPWLSNNGHIEHLWFDFHAEVKSGRWDRLVGLLEQVTPSLTDHGYFRAVPIDGEVIFRTERVQTGVIRTNCMDCLDRTNVVQSLFGRFMLFRQLSESPTVKVPLAFRTAMRLNPMTLPWTQGEVTHRHLWADNADAISRLYAGTPALKGDFTRTGKRTKKGALDDGMNSMQRYYLNNFLDADRQEGMDLLTGHQPFSNTAVEDYGEHGTDEDSIGEDTGDDYYGKSIQEAARLMLLGLPKDVDLDDEKDHVRIKISRQNESRKLPVGGAFLRRTPSSRPLGLLWLPGDLRSHVRSLATSDNSLMSSSSTLSSLDASDSLHSVRDALENVDRTFGSQPSVVGKRRHHG